ncbi:unnamed protein product [Blepharisma stoltei]|uniref:Uncharacterized protein n=1 Tax=Blepharisma stoltei TaxID=1481888 RepID=A0AAU9JEG1_9CILI|nr:unnamed protein product [Blepharisma stoltei]
MNYISILLLITLASAFQYLSATIHSQDVKPIPKREPWHPHLYLAHDEAGDFYEIRNSHEYYDVSVSFLQTKESSPGVMNCECRFVKSDLTDEGSSSETEFLQVITPNTQKRLEAAQQQEKERLKEIPIGVKPQFVQSTKPMRTDTRREMKNPQLIETNEQEARPEPQKKQQQAHHDTAKQAGDMQRQQENIGKRAEVPKSQYENTIDYEPVYAPRVFETPKQHVFRDIPPPAGYYNGAGTYYQPQVFQTEYRPNYIPETYPPPQYSEGRPQGYAPQYIEERPQGYPQQYTEERPIVYQPQYIDERPQGYQPQYNDEASQSRPVYQESQSRPVYQDERPAYSPQYTEERAAEYYDPRSFSAPKVVYVYQPYP